MSSQTSPVTSSKQFLLEQKFTPLINRYEFFSYTGEQKGERLAFVEQKRFSFKEQITAWTADDKTAVFFTLQAEKVLDLHGKFWVSDASGRHLGYLKKAFGKSLVRSTWEVHGADEQLLLTVVERNLPIAILRRYGGLLPLVGDLIEYLPFNFDFMSAGQKVGYSTRLLGLRDSYNIALDANAPTIDDRLLLALGLALDALQGR